MRNALNLNLLTKLLVGLTVLIILSLSVFAYLLTQYTNNQIENFRLQQATSHVASLAKGSVDSLLTQDYDVLESLVFSAKPSDDYVYALLSTPSGKILVHSSPEYASRQISPFEPITDTSRALILDKKYNSNEIIEVIQPILLGKEHIANAHVAYYKKFGENLKISGQIPVAQSIFTLLIALIIGIIVITKTLISPINSLTKIISSTNLDKPVPLPKELINKRDEVGSMANSFNDLIQRSSSLYSKLISEEKYLQQVINKLGEESQRLQITLSSIGDAVFTTDTQGIVQYINPVAEVLSGYKCHDAKGIAFPEIFTLVDEKNNSVGSLITDMSLKAKDNIHYTDLRLLHHDGLISYVDFTASPILDSNTSAIGVIIVVRDQTERKKLEHHLTFQAAHDPLTKLANRSEFERVLKNSLEINVTQDSHVVCFMDIDQFKIVNDSAGHAAGDKLLIELCGIFKKHIRNTDDLLARIGGDEFAILLTQCPTHIAERIANDICIEIKNHRFIFEDQVFTSGVSIGVTLAHPGLDTASEVMKSADAACFIAKDKGRNRVEIYDKGENYTIQRHGEMSWVSKITKALDDNNFALAMQPFKQLSEEDKSGVQLEILIRIKDGDNNYLSPHLFLPAAERYNKAIDIDVWVINETFRWFYSHPEYLMKLQKCSINLSGQSIGSDIIISTIENNLEKYNIDANKFCFEVTESSAIRHLDSALNMMQRLRKYGFKFSLDDFGCGMSSFSYLKNLPLDYLKIDGSFIRNIQNEPINQGIVTAINDVAHLMGLKTVAEYVSSQEIMDIVSSIGIDIAQGYVISKPIIIEESPEKIKELFS